MVKACSGYISSTAEDETAHITLLLAGNIAAACFNHDLKIIFFIFYFLNIPVKIINSKFI
jgi:hypothetical protein